MTRSCGDHAEQSTEGSSLAPRSFLTADETSTSAAKHPASNTQSRRLVAVCLLLIACCVAVALAPAQGSSSTPPSHVATLGERATEAASHEVSDHERLQGSNRGNDAPPAAGLDDSQALPPNSQASINGEEGRTSAYQEAERREPLVLPKITTPPSPEEISAGRKVLESFAQTDCGDMLTGVPSEPKAPYSYYRAHTVETSPVCISTDAYFYRLHPGPARTFQSKRATFRNGATERRDFTLERAFFRPMTDALLGEIGRSAVVVVGNASWTAAPPKTAAAAATTVQPQTVLHRSLGIFNGAWYNYHMFHCLIDALLGFNAVEVEFPQLRNAPHTHVWISNFLLNRYDGGKPKLPWNITLEFLRRMNHPPYPPIVILADGVVRDGRVHCFCGAAVTHSIEFRHRAFLLNERNSLASGRRGMALQIARLIEGFGLPPHGVEVRPRDLLQIQRFGWYKAVRSLDAPRMMVVLRQVDRRIDGDFFQRIGESVGFAVQLVRLERYSVEEQVALARFSDVLVAVHGAGATLQMFMDTVGFNAHCRTWIELVPWVQRWKLPVMMHQSILANISHDAIDATTIIFDSSVSRSLRRTVLRSKQKYSVGAFEYLHVPHELVYSEGDVRRVMSNAKKRWQRCGTVRE